MSIGKLMARTETYFRSIFGNKTGSNCVKDFYTASKMK